MRLRVNLRRHETQGHDSSAHEREASSRAALSTTTQSDERSVHSDTRLLGRACGLWMSVKR